VSDLRSDRPTKAQWRAELLAARRVVPVETRLTEASALAAQLRASGLVRAGQTVCAYVPIGAEPGGEALVGTLSELGATVLLPVTVSGAPLDWAPFAGTDGLVAAGYGLREPSGPRLGAPAIGGADVIFIPALAVDRTGTRLGRGAGYYDRSLGLARPGIPLVAVLRDAEFIAELPAQPHDVPVSHVLTPERGLIHLG